MVIVAEDRIRYRSTNPIPGATRGNEIANIICRTKYDYNFRYLSTTNYPFFSFNVDSYLSSKQNNIAQRNLLVVFLVMSPSPSLAWQCFLNFIKLGVLLLGSSIWSMRPPAVCKSPSVLHLGFPGIAAHPQGGVRFINFVNLELPGSGLWGQ